MRSKAFLVAFYAAATVAGLVFGNALFDAITR